MLKFIRGKGYQPSAERAKLQKQLFAFKKTVQHGFPHHPTALGWDPELRLLAIGTKTGAIKIFGTPGVEFYGEHESEIAVTRLFFLPNQGRVITLCEDNTLHLWEVNVHDNKSVLEEVKSCPLEGNIKKISACCLQSNCEQLYIGTECGNIYLLDVKSFALTDHIIYQDVVMQNVPDDFKVNPGAVEAISEHPSDPSKLLIGYNRGLLVLWDNTNLSAAQTYVGSQQLDSVSWHREGEKFMSAHNDGSYIIWNTKDASKPEQAATTPYGPFPCKGITRLQWETAKGDDYIIFSGGMPRASYGDRNTVTVQQGDNHVVFDLTSRVVDFITISESDKDSDYDNPKALVILAEEELVVVDLLSDNWPVFRPPYLASLHSSAVTCSQHFLDVIDTVWQKLIDIGRLQSRAVFSSRAWPITGGNTTATPAKTHDLLLTGHEDGTVKFWDASGVAMRQLCSISTATMFTGDEVNDQNAADEAEEWPPFRKVGYFDPYSDDPRLAVKKLAFCVLTGTLVVAGTAGQAVVYNLSEQDKEFDIKAQTVNIVSDRDGFAWKGHDQLSARNEVLNFPAGFAPVAVLQLYPPAACTSLALHTEWSLVAAGTAHGFALFDYIQMKSVMAKCTLNPNDLTGAGDTPISRRKSLKKSLRESFRRLRKGRSTRGDKRKSTVKTSLEENKEGAPAETEAPASPAAASAPASPTSSTEPKPVERQVEARTPDDAMGSMVRCLYLTNSFIISVAKTTPTLWAGTNSGAIFVFTISVPAKDKRKETNVACQLGKEVQLKHRAPVIGITILDTANVPVPEQAEIDAGRAKQPETAGYHRVLISSEEQFKIFTLPSLKPYCKFKLTAHEGSRTRRVGIARFTSNSNEKQSEWCAVCLTNLGDISIYSLPDLRRQTSTPCIRKEDINGILSLVFTKSGEAFYLHSSSELQRLALSTVQITDVECSLDLPEGSRPPPPPPPAPAPTPEPPVEVKEVVTDNEVAPAATEESPNQTEEKPEPPADVSIITLEEDRKEETADITIDSVRDHITTTLDESMNTVTERKEERIEVKREEHVTTVTKTATVIASSEAEAVAAVLAQE